MALNSLTISRVSWLAFLAGCAALVLGTACEKGASHRDPVDVRGVEKRDAAVPPASSPQPRVEAGATAAPDAAQGPFDESGSGAGLGDTGTARPPIEYHDGSSRLEALPHTNCTINVTTSEVSPHIATVGVVSFETDMAGVTAAEVHFGPDANYGLVAPVNLSEPGYRTLLLGMIQGSTYHYRVAVSDGASVCYGADVSIETGSLNLRPLEEVSTSDAAAPGFIVTSRDGAAVIYDKQGEPVWAHDFWGAFSVRMSWDGQYLIGRDGGPFDAGDGGMFFRVEMDGSEFTTIDAPGGDHHDFTVTPNGIAYLAKSAPGECDRVYEASLEIADGTAVFDTWQIYQYFPDEGFLESDELCHANRIHYLLDRDLYTISDRNKDAIAVFTRDGTPVTSIGKAPTGDWEKHVQVESAGPGGDWHVQHGHDLYADDKLVVFSNESSGGAAVLHYTIDGGRASLDWKYAGAGDSRIQGDVERLPNGNFLVTANLSGTIVELSPDGQSEVAGYVLGEPIGPLYGFNYTRHRASLYGAPVP